MKNKKIIAVLLAVVLAFSCLASYFSVLGQTMPIQLDTQYANTTNGSDDVIRYKFVPDASGVYTFLSYNTRKSEAYLFIKETQADGSKLYTQLAYSKSSPNYADYGQTNSSQFCLTYHLEEGKTYFFEAGWQTTSTTAAEMKVKLICEGYDDNLISKIEATCPTTLTWYTDGEWKTDANGKEYFYYNYAKIIRDTTIKVYYANGTTETVTGATELSNGLKITYYQNQIEDHWYVKADSNYNGNELTVTILDKTATVNVVIEQNELYPVKGMVIDYLSGEPVANAKIYTNSQYTTTTDEDGKFSFASGAGALNVKITTDNSIDRIFWLTITARADANDHTSTPYTLITTDYYDDEVINVKDLVTVKRSTTLTADQKTAEITKINQILGANEDIYE